MAGELGAALLSGGSADEEVAVSGGAVRKPTGRLDAFDGVVLKAGSLNAAGARGSADDAGDKALLLGEEPDGGEGEAEAGDGVYKQSRSSTVASIVNTMMGTTIVALPFGLAESGIGAGLGIILLLGAISCFTCLVIVEADRGAEDFSGCVRGYLGDRAQLVAWAISVAIIVGAAIVYHILMQETLYSLVVTLMASFGVTNVAATGWRREWAALIPWFLYPVSNMRDLSTLVRLNSVGFLFLAYVILFIVYHGLHALGAGAPMAAVATLPAGAPPYGPDGVLRIILGGSPSFASLGGMMMLSFFIHNCIQPIVKNADPKTRRVDITIS
jgi:sodium-coupled neutral amino acid transporter 9